MKENLTNELQVLVHYLVVIKQSENFTFAYKSTVFYNLESTTCKCLIQASQSVTYHNFRNTTSRKYVSLLFHIIFI